MATLLDLLQQSPAASGVVIPSPVAGLLRSVTLHDPVPAGLLPLQGSAIASTTPVPRAFGAALSGEVSWNLAQESQPGGGFILSLSGGVGGAGVPVPGSRRPPVPIWGPVPLGPR